MTVVDAALIGTVAALAVAMIAMSWRISRAIQKSADETNARIDAAVRDLGARIDAVSAKGDDTARYLGDKIDAVSAKGDDTARYLGAKIDTTNSMLSDIRERVAYLEGRADPPPKAA